MARKPVSASMRWQVFARDGFRCRYCGAQAGEDGVSLHADHVVSVADGGHNGMDNLVTACQRCNGGKSARSLEQAPGSAQSVSNSLDRAVSLKEQADAVRLESEAIETMRREAVNLWCDAYDLDVISVTKAEVTRLVTLIRQYGAEKVADWLAQASGRGVQQTQAVRYVNGIVRNLRERGEVA